MKNLPISEKAASEISRHVELEAYKRVKANKGYDKLRRVEHGFFLRALVNIKKHPKFRFLTLFSHQPKAILASNNCDPADSS